MQLLCSGVAHAWTEFLRRDKPFRVSAFVWVVVFDGFINRNDTRFWYCVRLDSLAWC
jgi:hypothetical protein